MKYKNMKFFSLIKYCNLKIKILKFENSKIQI